MEIGQRIKYYREKLGLTQAKLAERANMDSNNISRIERGEATPSLDTVMKLCNAFSISPNELLMFEYNASKELLIDEVAVLLKTCNEKDLKRIIEFIHFVKK